MQKIGERLEEARKRLGITLREAAEATKIRGDFLTAFEENNFDISLPEVYTRGFLKIYANYLKLDADRVLTDFDALRLKQAGKAAAPARGQQQQQARRAAETAERESLGSMEMPEEEGSEAPEPPRRERERAPEDEREGSSALGLGALDKTLYLKIGALLGGAVLLIVLVVLLFSLIAGGGGEDTQASGGAGAVDADTVAAQQERETITLIGQGDVSVVVRQNKDDRLLYSGLLAAGEERVLEVDGPVRIQYSEGDNLIVEKDGQRYRMGKSGIGRTTLD